MTVQSWQYSRTLFPGLEPTPYTTGVCPSQKIEELIGEGFIPAMGHIDPDQVQPASLDLRLGPVAYRVRASFLPGPSSTVLEKAEQYTTHTLDLTKPAVLEKGCVYIVPLQEGWKLPSDIAGKANPKSSTGRVDVFARLITDYSNDFERIAAGYRGPLYVEIVPRTFSVLVEEGTRVNQIRFIRGAPPPSDNKLVELHQERTLVYVDELAVDSPRIAEGLWISADLVGRSGSGIIGYRAKEHAPLLDLNRVDYYDPWEFWEPIEKLRNRSLILNPGDFYILASLERIRIPTEFAAEMMGYDPSAGEFRVHYAGFFDPGFGYGADDIKGTRAVLEVRSHEVPFLLEDGQYVGRLVFERLMAAPRKVYGLGIGSTYQEQDLSLSKHFKRYAPYG